MITLKEKIQLAHDRLERYKNALLEIAQAQIEIACDVYVQTDKKIKRHWLPRGVSKYFVPHDYIEISTEYDEIEIRCMWVGHGEPDQKEAEIQLHPVMLQEELSLEERKQKFREYLVDMKAKGDASATALRRATLEKRRAEMERDLAKIDEQLKDAS